MTRSRWWACARLAAAAAVLALIVQRLGTGPFLTGLRSVGVGSVIAASALALLTTACSAWRWCLVSRGLGVPLPFRTAMAAYYRSQFLNCVLPGGVLGDVHRAVRHGRDAGDLGRGLRAVAWERAAGQVVQVAVAVLVLSAVASPVRAAMPAALTAAVIVVLGAGLTVRAARPDGSTRRARVVRTVVADLRDAVVARDRWPGLLTMSLVVGAGHAATFVIATRAAGTSAPVVELLPLTMLVLLAAAVPANLAGWGPREGIAAWAFAAAGLGGAQGVAAATAFGVLVAASSLPGGIVLIADWFGRRSPRSTLAARPGAGRQPRRPLGALPPQDVGAGSVHG